MLSINKLINQSFEKIFSILRFCRYDQAILMHTSYMLPTAIIYQALLMHTSYMLPTAIIYQAILMHTSYMLPTEYALEAPDIL
jgi:hypothetical protein